MSVLVVVEGLSGELAEEVGAVPGGAAAAAPTQGAVGGCERLRAAAAAYTTGEQTDESALQSLMSVERTVYPYSKG